MSAGVAAGAAGAVDVAYVAGAVYVFDDAVIDSAFVAGVVGLLVVLVVLVVVSVSVSGADVASVIVVVAVAVVAVVGIAVGIAFDGAV